MEVTLGCRSVGAAATVISLVRIWSLSRFGMTKRAIVAAGEKINDTTYFR